MRRVADHDRAFGETGDGRRLTRCISVKRKNYFVSKPLNHCNLRLGNCGTGKSNCVWESLLMRHEKIHLPLYHNTSITTPYLLFCFVVSVQDA